MTDLRSRVQAALGDDYRIERELGGGGMSRLFLVEEPSLHRRVVVKVLPPEYASEVFAARFRKEIELAAHLQHPNILPVLTAGTREGLLYYIIPYLPGESLRHRLTGGGPLSVAEATEILSETADALAHAHAEGILHRDIKPENILLEGRHAVLTDFGVARALAESHGERLTEIGLAVGTPGYMAPEQAAGDREVDERADIYALATVGYEMLTGKAPFEGPTAQAVLAGHLTVVPKRVSTVRSEVPKALSDAIAKGLAKNPAERFQTAAQFRDALRIPATRPALPRRTWIALAGVLGLLVIGFVYARGRSAHSAALDPNLVAMAPFDVLAPNLSLWREGLVDIVSRNLDGAGPIRTISPTTVIRRWGGRGDPGAATELGRSTGAGLVVFGRVVGAGNDSVRLTATLLDARRGSVVSEFEVRDVAERLDRVADSLTVGLLRELGRTRPIGAVRLASLGSTSLPAIKLFLRAEQYYRQGQWDSTLSYAQRAVAIDSNFTLALRRIPT
jgi:serine/threonine-protein kinase